MADLTGAPDDPFLAWYSSGLLDPYAPPPPGLDLGGGGMHPTSGMPGGPALPPPPPPQQFLPAPDTALGMDPNAVDVPVAAGPVAPPMPAAVAPLPMPTPAPAQEPSGPPLFDPMHPLTAAPPGLDLGPPPPATEPGVPEQPPEYAQGGGVLGAIGQDASPLIKANPYEIANDVQAGRALADMDPEQRAILNASREAAAHKVFAAKQLDLATAQKEEAERNWAAYQEGTKRAEAKMADIEADSKRLSAQKLDTSYPGGKLAAVLMGVVGGLVQGRTGSPQNYGLQLVQQGIDDWVNKQKSDIENGRADLATRRGIVAEEFAKHGDLFRAAESARAAGYERQINVLQAEAQNYDPHGTTARSIADSIVGLRQAQGAALASARKNAVDEQSKLAAYELQLLDIAKKRQALGGGGAAGLDEKAVRPAAAWAKDYGITDPRVADLPPMTGKQFKEIVGGGYELQNKQAQAGQLERERGALPLFDDKGERIAFEPHGSTPKVDEFRAKASSTQEMVNLLDQAMAVRTGWSSDVGNSEEKQRLNAIMGKIKLAAKNAETLGAISESDLGLINGLVGAKDFSQFRDVKAGVDQARQNLIDSVRTAAVGAGMDPKQAARISYPNVWGGKAAPTSVEQLRADELNNPSHVPTGPTGAPVKRDPSTGQVLFE